ncbi:MAG: carboxypeptidase-like regulatory domain-containing protein, partial [bacterium]
MQVNQEGREWKSHLTFTISAPKLDYVRHSYFPPQFNPADTVWLDVVLRNRGGQNSPRMRAHLISRSPTIVVHQNEGEVAPIFINSPDSLATVRFRIYAHHLTIPGSVGYMTIALVSDQGFRDTVNFSLNVGQSRQNAPLGPDEYGYVAFDDTDDQWEVAPQYEWVEIDPQLGGPGSDTGIRDLGNEQDFSVLVDLPFAFKYYGEVSQRITICSNGWFSFMDERRNADFHNRRIPPAFGPRAQVCVFWDDLINYTDRNRNPIGGVFTWYDEENHRFIIEWSRMRRYVGMVNDSIRIGGENTFQAIIYDPQYYPTYTGDGEIVFQYHTVNNDPDIDPGEYDTPYATVGITNLDATGGLEYTYWNRYPTAAAPLRAGRVIKFTTKVIVVVGYVEGIITDAATGEPIPRAEIRGSRGSFAVSNAQGFYRMDNVLVGSDYSFTAWAPGYNDSTLSGFDVTEGETLRIDFSLLHPEMVINVEEITGDLQPGATNIRYY